MWDPVAYQFKITLGIHTNLMSHMFMRYLCSQYSELLLLVSFFENRLFDDWLYIWGGGDFFSILSHFQEWNGPAIFIFFFVILWLFILYFCLWWDLINSLLLKCVCADVTAQLIYVY